MNQTRKIRWLPLFLVGAPLILVGGCWTSILLLKKSAETSLNAKLEQLVAKGFSIDNAGATALHQQYSSAEDSEQWAQVIDALNTPAINQEYQGLPEMGTGKAEPPLGEVWLEQPLVEQLLSRHAALIDQLVALSQDNGPVELPIQFNSIGTLLPYTQNMRTAARVLKLEAAIAARTGDSEREFRAINSLFGCAIALQGEPIIVSNLVSMAIAMMANSQLQSAILGDRLSPEQLVVLQRRILQTSDLRSGTRALKGEVGLALQSIREMDSFGSTVPPMIARLLVHSGMADRAALRYIEKIETACEFPTDDLKRWQVQMATLEQSSVSGSFLAGHAERLAAGFLPALSAYTNALIRHKMTANMSRLGIAIRRYEKTHGNLPNELSQLSELDIDLSQFRMVDGNIPAYQLTPPSPTSEATTAQAVLWGFNPQPTASNLNPALSPIPPPPSQEATDAIWIWEFKK